MCPVREWQCRKFVTESQLNLRCISRSPTWSKVWITKTQQQEGIRWKQGTFFSPGLRVVHRNLGVRLYYADFPSTRGVSANTVKEDVAGVKLLSKTVENRKGVYERLHVLLHGVCVPLQLGKDDSTVHATKGGRRKLTVVVVVVWGASFQTHDLDGWFV